MTGVLCPSESFSSKSEAVSWLFFLLLFSFRLSIEVLSATYCICHRKSEMCFSHKIQLSTWWKAVISSFYRFVHQSWVLAPWVVLSLLRKAYGLSWCWYIQFLESLQQTCLASRSAWRLQLSSSSPAAQCAQRSLWQLSRAWIHLFYFKSFMAADIWADRKHQSKNIIYLIRKHLPPKPFIFLLLFPAVSDLLEVLPESLFYLSRWPALRSFTRDMLCSRELSCWFLL